MPVLSMRLLGNLFKPVLNGEMQPVEEATSLGEFLALGVEACCAFSILSLLVVPAHLLQQSRPCQLACSEVRAKGCIAIMDRVS